MRRRWLLLSLLFLGTTGFSALSVYKTWTREVLTSADLNATISRLNTGINDVRTKFESSGAVLDVAQVETDTLDASSLTKLTVIVPLVSYSYLDSLDYHRVRVDRVHVDTMYVGWVPTTPPVFSLALTPGKQMKAPYIDLDTLAGGTLVPAGYRLTAAAGDFDSLLNAVYLSGAATLAGGGTLPAGKTLTGSAGSIVDLTAVTPDSVIGNPKFTGTPVFSAGFSALLANINSGSIDATTIGAATAAAGTFTDLASTGGTTIGNATGDALTFHPGAWTLSNAVTITGTWANLGTVTTADINGGTVDGVTIGGASAGAGTFTTITPTTIAGNATFSGTPIFSSGFSALTANINSGSIDNTTIGAATAAAGTFTTGSFTGASITAADNLWMGLGAAKGRVEFDDTTVDEVNILGANVGIGTQTPNKAGYTYAVTFSAGETGGAQAGLEIQGSRATTDGAFAYIDFLHRTTSVAYIHADRDGANNKGALVFSTNNAAGYPSDRWKITAAGDLLPVTDNTNDIGSAAARIDSMWISVAAVVGKLPFLEDRDDVGAIKRIRGSGVIDPVTGFELVDDSTLPKEIVVAHRSAGVHEELTAKGDTVLVPHEVGDPVKTIGGEYYWELTPTIGQLQGAVRQLSDSLDAVRARLDRLGG